MATLTSADHVESSRAPEAERVRALERELKRQTRRLRLLRIECDGLRDWAEAAEAELTSIKRTLWYRLLVGKD